ncbi:MAG: DoxX family protein [Isosphaeraceae bacterium]
MSSQSSEMVPPPPRMVDGPSLAARSSISLMLRLALGVQLLNGGISNFYIGQWIRGAGSSSGFGTYAQTGVFPGTEVAYSVLPFVQMAIGLAVLLGFFTSVAALLAGISASLPMLLQTFALLGADIQPSGLGFRGVEQIITQTIMGCVMALNVLIASGLIWFAGSGWNAWSLDTLMFGNRPRRRARQDRPKRPGVRGLGGSADADFDSESHIDHSLFNRSRSAGSSTGLTVPFSADCIDIPDASKRGHEEAAPGQGVTS